MTRLPLTLSLDLDDAWTYMRAAGRGDWQHAPSVVTRVCERLVALTGELGIRLSLFVVAQDLADPARRTAIRGVAEAGHEIGCHSVSHDPCFATLPDDAMRHEVAGAAAIIERELGIRPRGFRAPGYAFNDRLPAILKDAGFTYDGSILPTFLGPACRAYYFFKSGLTAADRERRAAMYGRLRDCLGSNRPRPLPACPQILEIPVTTVPLLRTPFHMSYVIWLARRSRALALAYARNALRLCRLFRVPPSYLLHSLDFVGRGEERDLDFFPGMDVTWEVKLELLRSVLGAMRTWFDVMPMGDFVARRGVGARAWVPG